MFSNRALGMGIMASLLVIAAVCVFNENTLATPAEMVAESKKSGDDISHLRGTALLAAESARVNKKRGELDAGHNMKAVDDMIHGFQTSADSDFASSLTAAAVAKDDWAMPSPDASGNIKQVSGMNGIDTSMDGSDEDDVLLQTSDEVEDWKPSGQSGMADALAQAHSDEDDEKDRADGLSGGSDILGAAGIGSQDPEAEETMFFQAPPTSVAQAKAEHANKKDDSVVVHAVPVARTLSSNTFDDGNQYDDEHFKEDNVFEGDSILSAVGIKDANMDQASQIGTISTDDFDFEFKPEN